MQAKDFLFTCSGADKTPQRRGEDKLRSDVNDILEEIKRCDDGEVSLPKFLSDGFSKMPPFRLRSNNRASC